MSVEWRPLRRLAAKLWGSGPTGLASFSDLAIDERETIERGVHGPEPLTGIIRSEAGDTFRYRGPTSLLGQQVAFAVENGHPVHRVDALVPSRRKVLYVLHDAGVIGDQGAVYSRKARCMIAETAALWDEPAKNNSMLSAPRFPAPVSLNGVTFTLSSRSTASYFHLIHDALARLHLLGSLVASVDQFIVNGPADSFARGWLERAGVPINKIVWANPMSHFACDQLLFTSELGFDQQPTPWNLRAVHSVLRHQPVQRQGKRLLWLSRKSAATRQLAWENKLLQALPEFEECDLSQLAPDAQLALLSDAAVIAGPHGAGFTNIAFCPPGTIQIELFPSFPIMPLYSRWAQVAGGIPYWAVIDFKSANQLQELVAALRHIISTVQSDNVPRPTN
jgi:capsular polysaccharide biosynthesis protein